MIIGDTVMEEGSANFDHLGFLNVHLNMSTQASNIFIACIKNAVVVAGI